MDNQAVRRIRIKEEVPIYRWYSHLNILGETFDVRDLRYGIFKMADTEHNREQFKKFQDDVRSMGGILETLTQREMIELLVIQADYAYFDFEDNEAASCMLKNDESL